MAGKGDMRKASIKTFLDQHEGCVILRHKSMTKEHSNEIQEMTEKFRKEGLPYDGKLLFTSILNHFTSGKADKAESKEFKKSPPKALICSNIMIYIFNKAGIPIKYPSNITAKEVWPKDVMLSPSMEVVAVYFDKESGMAPKK